MGNDQRLGIFSANKGWFMHFKGMTFIISECKIKLLMCRLQLEKVVKLSASKAEEARNSTISFYLFEGNLERRQKRRHL